MTDRVKGLTVTFDKDIRFEDVEPLVRAIKMFKGVANVAPSISDVNDHMNRERIKHELREKFWIFCEKNLE